MKKGLDRREFITKGGLAVAGATLAVSGLGAILSGCDKEPVHGDNGNIKVPEYPFAWVKLDPDAVAERAYNSYKESG